MWQYMQNDRGLNKNCTFSEIVHQRKNAWHGVEVMLPAWLQRVLMSPIVKVVIRSLTRRNRFPGPVSQVPRFDPLTPRGFAFKEVSSKTRLEKQYLTPFCTSQTVVQSRRCQRFCQNSVPKRLVLEAHQQLFDYFCVFHSLSTSVLSFV